MIHWFEVIGQVLRDPAILAENFYNMDETGVMLSMLGSVKVLVGKDDKQKHRGAVTRVSLLGADPSANLRARPGSRAEHT
jgi:hypothetical protein